MLPFRQQLTMYRRKSKKPMLRNRNRLLWSLLSEIPQGLKSLFLRLRALTLAVEVRHTDIAARRPDLDPSDTSLAAG